MNKIQTNGISLSVTVNGRAVNTFLHEGKYFIESRTDTEYSIDIKNDNSYRVEAVVSVDGLSVISGKSASKEERGYIINAWNSINIKGFRKDNETVGAFKFTKKEKSYAKSKGLEGNVGVIAIAVFKEKVKVDPVPQVIYKDIHHYHDEYWWPDIKPYYPQKPRRYYEPTWVCNNTQYGTATCNNVSTKSLGGTLRSAGVNFCSTTFNDSVPITAATNSYPGVTCSVTDQSCEKPAEFEHGTTWGTKIADKVITTTFEREYQIVTQEIFYNSKENLEAMGIKFIQEKQIAFPKGFPSDFAEPPVGWNG